MRGIFSKPIAAALCVIVIIFSGVIIFRSEAKKPELPAAVPLAPSKKSWPVSQVIGHSVLGRSIESYTYGNGKNNIVFVGGMHGGYEWNSVLLAYDLIDYLNKDQAEFPKNLMVTVIPSLNPDGVYEVTGKEGRFATADVATNTAVLAKGRFNADGVDLNRNFDCNWQPKATWQNKTESAGKSAFSEPESQVIKNYALQNSPAAFVFWHSQADSIYGSNCNGPTLPETTDIMNAYAKASGYPEASSFDSYPVTGDSTDWLASIKIPAITVELSTHQNTEWDKNLKGILALFDYYSKKN